MRADGFATSAYSCKVLRVSLVEHIAMIPLAILGIAVLFGGPVLLAWNLIHPWLQEHGYMQL